MQINVDGKTVFEADNVKSFSVSTPRGPAAVGVGVEKGDLIEIRTTKETAFNRPLDQVEAEARKERREASKVEKSEVSDSGTTKKTASKKSE